MINRLRTRLRSSPRTVALYRALRTFVPGGGPGADGRPRGTLGSAGGVAMLRRIEPIASPRSEYRLNLVLPTVEATRTFGGIRTALDVFEAIGADAGQRRIITLKGSAAGAGDLLRGYSPVEPGEDPPIPLQFVALERSGSPLAVRADDVFVATFWTTADLVARIRRWQGSTYGRAPERFAYVIQDYEPGFYPWSAESMLARATYEHPNETIGVFNTSTLRDYFGDAGIRFGRTFAFEPRLLPELRAAIAAPAVPRSRTILVYGRPRTPRNGFPAITDGLRAWRASDPGAGDWTVLSVGQPHPDVDLGGGLVLRSAGKLDLASYAALLREAAIGISLMISPHPSYPPLEMAHLGMLVLTNRFEGKDLATWHSNISTTDDISAEPLAARLSELCRRFESDPDAGASGRSGRPDFVSDDPQFPFAAELAAELRAGALEDAPRPTPGAGTDPPEVIARP